MSIELTRPAVSLTDFALAIECTAFTALLLRRTASDTTLRNWFAAFFASVAVASLLGGVLHGFFEYSTSPVREVLWTGTLLSILVTSFTVWSLGALLQLRPAAVRWVQGFALVQMVVFSFLILFVTRVFTIVIAAYLPATVFLLVTMWLAWRRHRHPALAAGVAGLLLVFVGAAVQQLGVVIHPVYLDHNTLYHVIQGIALWMLYRAGSWSSVADPSVRKVP